MQFLFEMIFVGVALVIVSLGINLLSGESISSKHVKPMIKGIFMTGAIAHLLFELFGVNAYYVKHYKPLMN